MAAPIGLAFAAAAQHAELCVLRVSPDVLELPNVVVTDGNAASTLRGYARFAAAPDGLGIVNRDTASAVEDAVTGVDIDDVYARAGKHQWGYVEPGAAALEILDSAVEPFIEDIRRQIDLGLDAEAVETCKGVVLGLYRVAQESKDEVLQWAPEFPAEAAGHAIEVWLGEPNASGKHLKRSASRNRPFFPQTFVDQFVPQWSGMISRIVRAK
jgi:hypothetical protein